YDMPLLSVRNIITGAVLIGAYVLFRRAGGAEGLGSSIGGGLSSFSTGVTGGLQAAGSTWGGLFEGWGDAFTRGLNSFGASITSTVGGPGGGGGGVPSGAPQLPAPAPAGTAGDVVEALGLGDNVVRNSYNPNTQLTESQRSLLSLAGVFQSLGFGHDVDLENQRVVYEGGLGEQDLSFALRPTGEIRTGVEGLSPSTIAYQQRLAQEYGIVTFDVEGNISNVGGYTAAL
ncbi:MAG: hypothetical protein OXR67_13210, partial [Chloroflexota bacterium]|nr:hypothetical protein [Chloroflexota bacterium]